MTTMNTTEITLVTDETLPVHAAQSIHEGFAALYQETDKWRTAALAIIVTDPDDRATMKKARDARLALKNIRVSAEKRKKELKEDSLRYGRAVDGAYNMLAHAIVPLEKHLQEQEDYAERVRAERRITVHRERAAILTELGATVTADLSEMTPEEFAVAVQDAKDLAEFRAQKAKREEEERLVREKIERDRIAAEAKARAEEEERIRAENARLKAEAIERENQARIEREEAAARAAEIEAKADAERKIAEAAAREERIAREKIEAEARALREAEAARLREEEKARLAAESAARKAAQAPDREKILIVSKDLRALMVPIGSSPKGKLLADAVAHRIQELAAWIEAQAETLS